MAVHVGVLRRGWARWSRTARVPRVSATRPAAPATLTLRLPATNAAEVLAYTALLVQLYPHLRMPGPRRYDPSQADWCICAVPLLWTNHHGWVHLATGQPCLMPRGQL